MGCLVFPVLLLIGYVIGGKLGAAFAAAYFAVCLFVGVRVALDARRGGTEHSERQEQRRLRPAAGKKGRHF